MIQWLGYLALVLIVFNGSFYVLFRIVRKSRNRKRQIRYAKIAKILMRVHRKTAVVAAVFATAHSMLALYRHGVNPESLTQLSGVLAMLALIVLLSTGWIRNQKATGRRKRSHRYTAFGALLVIGLHILISLY
ncbi:hypothetical protein [Salisediminibacterium selenitireducens]|uniref:Uncharacterized protein n=1 Tax=Bacillus selenitireducens (strain ATCC 700615 / DSM 15326 / MLS10) TaxID=439292 RepID=D6XZ82_BACIE|nr:hypothetical protein [Salisediminibacterium selenitireducens]ADI00367.1 hypothetical protein Bsel_2878 [[Bacillus] selenitireducens MLS10]